MVRETVMNIKELCDINAVLICQGSGALSELEDNEDEGYIRLVQNGIWIESHPYNTDVVFIENNICKIDNTKYRTYTLNEFIPT